MTRAVLIVSRINWNEDRNERTLEIVDLATHARRALPSDPVRTADLLGRWMEYFARHLQ